MAQINDNNFIVWKDAGGVTERLPKPFRADLGHVGYPPVLVTGETLSLYLNADTPLGGGATLVLVRARDGSTQSLGALSTHAVNGGVHLYGSFTLPAIVPGELYYLTAGALTSETYFLGMTAAEAAATTTRVRFRHDRYFYGIPYHELPTFYQEFRLHIHGAEENPEGEKEIYKAVTSGKPRTFQNFLDWVVKVTTHHFDDRAHRAAAVMFEHSFLELNGREYRQKSIYKRDNNERSGYNRGECELYDVAFSSANRC